MELDFTDEQEMLRELVRGVCTDQSPPEVVRRFEDDPVGYPQALWSTLAELDLIGLTVPTEYGGSGMTMLEAVILHEELGRALAPSPLFATAVVAAGVLQRAGSEDQRRTWLPRICAGEAVIAPAWLEPGHGFGERGVQLTAGPEGDGWVLRGEKWHVPFAAAADLMVVPARTQAGVDLFLVTRDAEGISMSQQKTLAGDTQYAICFDGVRVAAEDRVGAAGSGWATWSDTLLDGMILLGAQAMGGARMALEMTVQYSKDRVQFGKPLGAFQALAHDMADARTAVDGGTLLVYEAAWARAAGHTVDRLAPMAKLFACQTFRDVTATAQQVFGGVGFTLDHDIQLYFRRAKQMQLNWCDDRTLEELVAAAVLDG